MEKKKRSHLNLLFDIGQLTDLLRETSDISNFLKRATELVAHHLDADVCSIYLYEDANADLVLKGTKGLNENAIGKVRMKPGEGLVGYSFESFETVLEGNAQSNPKFKYFIEADEDPYNSFICVPIRRGVEKIGVLVVQDAASDYFDNFDIRALKAAASQLAGSLENIRLLMEVEDRQRTAHEKPRDSIGAIVKGTPAAGGYAYAPATVIGKNRSIWVYQCEGEATCTKEDFYLALKRTTQQLKSLQDGFQERLPESASLIFTAHFLMLKDHSFSGRMAELIDEGESPVNAVKIVSGQYIELFTMSSQAYMREKALDVEDLALRILGNLKNDLEEDAPQTRRIAIARELFPSDILKLASGEVPGIILVGGGVASHVAILSRSLRIPLIIADEPALLDLEEKTPILMDADQGNIYIHPGKETVQLFESSKPARESARRKPAWISEETRTADGIPVTLFANINLLGEVKVARELKAAGIGLYRTEFPFLIRATFPSEQEQYVVYKKLFDAMGNRVVTIRTLDVGGDKTLAYSNATTEENPELGMRSIRFSFQHRDIFENQIRAVLRAAHGYPNARIMFPLISSVDELLDAKRTVHECMVALAEEGIDYNSEIAVGMMIELPSVLGTLDGFAREADFFSIGTNDFIQYMLAADRTNKLVQSYYLPHHPSVLRGLKQILEAGDRAGIDVSICGEMAHEFRYLPFLLGIGARVLSVDPQFLPTLKAAILNIDLHSAEEHAATILEKDSVREIEVELNALPMPSGAHAGENASQNVNLPTPARPKTPKSRQRRRSS